MENFLNQLREFVFLGILRRGNNETPKRWISFLKNPEMPDENSIKTSEVKEADI